MQLRNGKTSLNMQLRNGKIINLNKKPKNNTKIIEKEDVPVQDVSVQDVPEIIYNLNKSFNERLVNFIEIIEESDISTIQEVLRVMEVGKRIIISLLCWLSEPDIMQGMITYYPVNIINYNIFAVRLSHIVNEINKNFIENDEICKTTNDFICDCKTLLRLIDSQK